MQPQNNPSPPSPNNPEASAQRQAQALSQSFATSQPMRAHLEARLGFVTELSSHTLDALRQVSELQLQFCRAVCDEITAAGRSLLTARDSADLAARLAQEMQPSMERWRDYQQRLMNLMTGTQIDLASTAGSHTQNVSRTAIGVAEDQARRITEGLDLASDQVRQMSERMTEAGEEQRREVEQAGRAMLDQAAGAMRSGADGARDVAGSAGQTTH